MERTFYNEAELRAFAVEFSGTLKAGDIVGFSGALGSGKTAFVRAIVAARLGDDRATSPSFTFWHRYEGRPPVDHLDLYRIEDPSELRDLGLEDALAGDSIVLVEWCEHAHSLIPHFDYVVNIRGSGDEPRHLRIEKR